MSIFPTQRASELEAQPEHQRWLIEHLWAEQGVGIVGGEPKCCKSFLVLDMAVAVASGAACLRRFPVHRSGPVLLFAAEDALHVVRERLEGICAVAGASFASLDLHVITAPVVRLDLDTDRRRLRDTVATLQPRLLVLDPFVRLHRVDENTAAEVAPLLAYLRELQRHHKVAVALVHHARKIGHARAGQALRGSSELHAWGDSNLYLRRKQKELWLSTEHRAAPSIAPLRLELFADDESVALRPAVCAPVSPDASETPSDRILIVLREADDPMTQRALRTACRMRAQSIGEALTSLIAAGRVHESEAGYQLA